MVTEIVVKPTLGRRIRIAREKRGITQIRLGSLLIPPKSGITIADIEAGRSQATWQTVIQIARVLEENPDYFTDEACPECRREY